MKTVTLRNLPRELAREVGRRARERGLSLNRTVVELLAEHLGTAGRSKRTNVRAEDPHLVRLSGSWSADEGRAFDETLARQREIDPDLWK